MTQSSEWGGRRDFDINQADADATVDPYIMRDFVANNLMHAADQVCARVLVNDIAADDSYIVDNVDQFTTCDPSSAYWRPCGVFGPFAISTRVDGDQIKAYRMRCGVYGASSSGGTSVTFAIQFLPYTSEVSARSSVDAGGIAHGTNAVLFDATTSTTPAWLTASSSADVVCEINRDAWSTMVHSTVGIPGSTEPVSVETHMVLVRVLATGTVAARLYGVHVAEVL